MSGWRFFFYGMSMAATNPDIETKRAKRLPWWLKALCALALLFLAARGAGHLWIEYQLEKEYAKLPPAQAAIIKDFWDKPFHIPDEWLEPLPSSPELTAAVNRLFDARDKYLIHAKAPAPYDRFQYMAGPVYEQIERDGGFTPKTWAEARMVVEAYQSVFAAMEECASLPDYHLEALIDTREGLLHPTHGPNLFFVTNVRLCLVLKSKIESQEKEWGKIIENYDFIFKTRKIEPGSWHLTHFSHYEAEYRMMQIVKIFREKCCNSEALRKFIRQRKNVENQKTINFKERLILNLISQIKCFKKFEYPIQIKPITKGKILFRDFVKTTEYYPYWRIKTKLSMSMKEREILKKHKNNRYKAIAPSRFYTPPPYILYLMRNRSFYNFLLSEEKILEWYHLSFFADKFEKDYLLYRNLCQGLSDLIFLDLARRVRELEGGAPTSQPLTAEEIEQFFPDGMSDPFSDPPAFYKWSAGRGTYYSVGPDGIDDGAIAGGEEAENPGEDLFLE